MANQKVGAEAHDLPRDVQGEQVIREHESKHSGAKQLERRKEPHILGVAVHVANRVKVDEETHGAHDDDHHRAQIVYQRANRHCASAPGKVEPRDDEAKACMNCCLTENVVKNIER